MSEQFVTVGQVVEIHFTLKDADGQVLATSSGGEPVEFLTGARNIAPGLERALMGKGVGEAFAVDVAPADGYGEHDPAGVHTVPRDRLPADAIVTVGMHFATQGPNGRRVPVWVKAIEGDNVTMDLNHPLAGKHLRYEVTVVSIREATEDEKAHGHPHGPGGHHH